MGRLCTWAHKDNAEMYAIVAHESGYAAAPSSSSGWTHSCLLLRASSPACSVVNGLLPSLNRTLQAFYVGEEAQEVFAASASCDDKQVSSTWRVVVSCHRMRLWITNVCEHQDCPVHITQETLGALKRMRPVICRARPIESKIKHTLQVAAEAAYVPDKAQQQAAPSVIPSTVALFAKLFAHPEHEVSCNTIKTDRQKD